MATTVSQGVHIPTERAAVIRDRGDLQVVQQVITGYRDRFLKDPLLEEQPGLVLDSDLGTDTRGPPPSNTPESLALAARLKDFFDFSDSSLTPFETRRLAYSLGLTPAVESDSLTGIHPGDRVQFSDGGRTTRGIVASASPEGVTILGTHADNRFGLSYVSEKDSGVQLERIVSSAAPDSDRIA